MRNTITILAIAAAGVVPLTAEPAEAGVSVSFGLNLGRHPRPVVVSRPLGLRVAVSRPVRAPAPVPVTILPNNHTISNLSGHARMGRYFRVHVPAGQTYLTVLTEGGWGDNDLYLARDYLPTPGNYQYVSSAAGTDEQISILYPPAGYWYVLVHGAGTYGGASLLASWWQQEVYYEDQTYYVQPSSYAGTQVYVYWDYLGRRRPAGGLIPFILSSLRHRHRARHRLPPPRPQGSHRGPTVPHRPPAPVRPRAGSHPPVRPAVPRGGSRPPARPAVPRVGSRPPARPAVPRAGSRGPARPAVPRVDSRPPARPVVPRVDSRPLARPAVRPAAPPRRPAVPSTVRRTAPTNPPRPSRPPATARTTVRRSTPTRTEPARAGGARRPSVTSGRSRDRRR